MTWAALRHVFPSSLRSGKTDMPAGGCPHVPGPGFRALPDLRPARRPRSPALFRVEACVQGAVGTPSLPPRRGPAVAYRSLRCRSIWPAMPAHRGMNAIPSPCRPCSARKTQLAPAAARNSLAARLASRLRPLNVFPIRLGVENAATSPFAQGFLRLATAQLRFNRRFPGAPGPANSEPGSFPAWTAPSRRPVPPAAGFLSVPAGSPGGSTTGLRRPGILPSGTGSSGAAFPPCRGRRFARFGPGPGPHAPGGPGPARGRALSCRRRGCCSPPPSARTSTAWTSPALDTRPPACSPSDGRAPRKRGGKPGSGGMGERSAMVRDFSSSGRDCSGLRIPPSSRPSTWSMEPM